MRIRAMKHLALTLTCVALLSIASQQSQAGVIYSEGFESGTAPGWGLDDSGLNAPPALVVGGLWHVTENAPASGRFALGYVHHETPGPFPNGDYDTGDGGESVNFGSAASPVILLPNGTATLYFDILSDTGADGPPGFFADFLNVTDEFGGILATTLNAGMFPFAVQIPGGTYHRIAIDISAYAGGLFFVDFSFNTFDGFFNDHPGIRIDNVEIDSAFPEPSTFVLSSIVLGIFGAALVKRSESSAALGIVGRLGLLGHLDLLDPLR